MPDIGEVVGYQYNADRYCIPCTERAFAAVIPSGSHITDMDILPADSEGNTITPLHVGGDSGGGWYTNEQYYEVLECAFCSRFIDEHYNDNFCDCGDGCYSDDCGQCDDVTGVDPEDGECMCTLCLEAESPPFTPEAPVDEYMAWAATLA